MTRILSVENEEKYYLNLAKGVLIEMVVFKLSFKRKVLLSNDKYAVLAFSPFHTKHSRKRRVLKLVGWLP